MAESPCGDSAIVVIGPPLLLSFVAGNWDPCWQVGFYFLDFCFFVFAWDVYEEVRGDCE